MDLSASTFWWIVTGALIVVELTTGTFYLLMFGLGTAAGAVAAHLGCGVALQLTAAAAIGGGATAVWHWTRFKHPSSPPVAQNKDVHLDIGELVMVPVWTLAGTAQVSYRGSNWQARLQEGAPAQAGPHRIVAVEGNLLILVPHLAVR